MINIVMVRENNLFGENVSAATKRVNLGNWRCCLPMGSTEGVPEIFGTTFKRIMRDITICLLSCITHVLYRNFMECIVGFFLKILISFHRLFYFPSAFTNHWRLFPSLCLAYSYSPIRYQFLGRD